MSAGRSSRSSRTSCYSCWNSTPLEPGGLLRGSSNRPVRTAPTSLSWHGEAWCRSRSPSPEIPWRFPRGAAEGLHPQHGAPPQGGSQGISPQVRGVTNWTRMSTDNFLPHTCFSVSSPPPLQVRCSSSWTPGLLLTAPPDGCGGGSSCPYEEAWRVHRDPPTSCSS